MTPTWPSSPPARQAAAPVRGGDESGLAPEQKTKERTHTQWIKGLVMIGSDETNKIERRPPEADPRGIDSRGVGCGDNWTGGGLRGKRLTESSAHSASTSVYKK